MGLKSKTVRKPLDAIWKDSRVWSAMNTMLVDDSPAKAYHHPRNLYNISTFDVEDHSVDSRQDSQLLRLSTWLDKVDFTKDIRDQLELLDHIGKSKY